MAKMREFLFWNESGQEEKKENTSFKKAVKSVQENFKNQLIGYEYISNRRSRFYWNKPSQARKIARF